MHVKVRAPVRVEYLSSTHKSSVKGKIDKLKKS